MQTIPEFTVKLVRSERGTYTPIPIRAAVDASNYLEFLKESDREQFVVLLLNSRNEIIGFNVVSIGTVSASLVHPREVFKPAILSNASAILVAHNHPSGDPQPSKEDFEVTLQLIGAGKMLNIPVVDHIVIGDTTVSIRDLKPNYDW